jgi:hypothetical protein
LEKNFRAFKPPRSEVSLFRKGMKLEAVDKRNPAVIRVASVADVLMHQVKVRFKEILQFGKVFDKLKLT